MVCDKKKGFGEETESAKMWKIKGFGGWVLGFLGGVKGLESRIFDSEYKLR